MKIIKSKEEWIKFVKDKFPPWETKSDDDYSQDYYWSDEAFANNTSPTIFPCIIIYSYSFCDEQLTNYYKGYVSPNVEPVDEKTEEFWQKQFHSHDPSKCYKCNINWFFINDKTVESIKKDVLGNEFFEWDYDMYWSPEIIERWYK